MMYDDAFSIQLVDDVLVKDLNYVAGAVPMLLKIGHDLSSGYFNAFDQRTITKLEIVQALCL